MNSLTNQVGTSINCDAIIMGDFNVDANQFDKYARLDSLMTSYGYKQVITTPTRVTDDTASIIDHVYVTNVDKVKEAAVSDIAISDHLPIGITWCFSASHKDSSNRNIHKSISYRSTKNFNINHYIYDLSQIIWPNKNDYDNVDDHLNAFNDSFLHVINTHAPIMQKHVKRDKQPKWITREIINEMFKRDSLRKRGCFTEYRISRNKVVSMIRSRKVQFYRQIIANTNGHTGRLWRCLGEITGRSSANKESVHMIQVNDEIIGDKNEITNSFVRYFSNVASELVSSHKWINTDEYRPSERFLQFVAVNLQDNSTSPFSISLLRPFEVRDLILSLKRTNSVGTDGITSRFLRLAANVIASPMCEILNRSITECTFPALWKTARVIPVHKGSAKDNMNNI